MEQLLIIEDDKGLNQGLSKALKADNRQIISCQDLKTARDQLLCGEVSLVLLDINLPDGSGLDLLQEIKTNMPNIEYAHITLITDSITTGHIRRKFHFQSLGTYANKTSIPPCAQRKRCFHKPFSVSGM